MKALLVTLSLCFSACLTFAQAPKSGDIKSNSYRFSGKDSTLLINPLDSSLLIPSFGKAPAQVFSPGPVQVYGPSPYFVEASPVPIPVVQPNDKIYYAMPVKKLSGEGLATMPGTEPLQGKAKTPADSSSAKIYSRPMRAVPAR